MRTSLEKISPDLFVCHDTCHVYIVRSGEEAVLVDFGDGAALSELSALGVKRISAVLITHHHRDQCQGLVRALAERPECLLGTRILAPHSEQDLFHSVEEHWQARPLLHNYDTRQDRFSLLASVPLDGTLKDYQQLWLGGRAWTVWPTPGHTPGSLTLLAEIDGQTVAFTGDLIAGPGKVWSMAAFQWQYQDAAGAAVSIPSLISLRAQAPDLLLPSHGEPMPSPAMAIDLLVQRLRRLLDERQENLRMDSWLREPYVRVTRHLLRNRTSVSNSYVLLSESGKALLIDYGYDFVTTNLSSAERSVHRPWLYTLPVLKRDFGVGQIDVVLPTHHHDDHVAGFNLLREVEGTQVWAAENFADILEQPNDYDLPCLWYDPIPVDRRLPLEQPVQWEEYALTLFPLPGHTRYAVAIGFEVDGQRVLATGDQYKGGQAMEWNYVYQNGFAMDDYQFSAGLVARFAPDLILPGHWEPQWLSPADRAALVERLEARGLLLGQLHRDLLAEESQERAVSGPVANIQPYHAIRCSGEAIDFQVEVRNPLSQTLEMQVNLVLPDGWQSPQDRQIIYLEPGAAGRLCFTVLTPSALRGRRFRLAVDLSAGLVQLGQQAEALVDLE